MGGRGSGEQEQEQEHVEERARRIALRHSPSAVVGGESMQWLLQERASAVRQWLPCFIQRLFYCKLLSGIRTPLPHQKINI